MTAPRELREAVLARALADRPAGRPVVQAAEPCSPADAFRRAIDELFTTLTSLSRSEWSAPGHADYGSVHDVIAHLVGVERLSLEWTELPAGSELQPTEHAAATRAAVEELRGVDGEVVARIWRDAALAFHATAAAADPEKPVLAHDLPTDVEGLLVLRSFELWAHLDDVCRATGRARPGIDPARRSLMSTRLMEALPVAAVLRGVAQQGTVRFVLTDDDIGAARLFDVVVGDDGTDHAVVVADTTDVCRVAARRLPAAQLTAHIDGDPGLALAVLSALDAFARD